MEELSNFLKGNYKWFFAGLGILLLTLLGKLFFKEVKTSVQSHFKNKHLAKIVSKDQQGGVTAHTVGNINITDVSRRELKVLIESYIKDLSHNRDAQYGRIDELPYELTSRIQALLESRPMGANELAKTIGVTDKMMDNLLKAMVNKGLLDFNGKNYSIAKLK